MAKVSLERISKRFPDGTTAVDDVSLEIIDREFLVLVGPSGCGKSTTLRLIAGLEDCTAGTIRIGEHVVNDVAPKDRDVAMVFQNYALYPHMSVYRNLSFGLTLRYGGGVFARGLRKIFRPRLAKELARLRGGIDTQVRQTASRLGIEHLLKRKPHQLSGGERQRVALGRAIVRNPAAFLFDEPLSNLDAKLRQQMRVELRRLHRELQATMIYVTHDQVEAMTLGDRVAVMEGGKILQVGRPLNVYQQPANLFVARFIGNVPMNLLPGTVTRTATTFKFSGGGLQLGWTRKLEKSTQAVDRETDLSNWESMFSAETSADQQRDAVIGFRAENLSLAAKPLDRQAVLDAEVFAVDRLGESTLVHLQRKVNAGDVREEVFGDGSLVARLPANCELSPGDRLELVIDREKVLWFDPLTGQNLLKEES
jgi:ABC-type sugar transport system ATPase subunit